MVVIVFGGDWGVFAVVLDFREVMLTSPPELTHCGGGGRLLAARSEAGPETWKSGWLRRFLLVAGRSKLLAVRRKKERGTW